MSVYQDNGYENRREYLECLAEDYGVDLQTVFALAEMLGRSEDFDGLVSALEDVGMEHRLKMPIEPISFTVSEIEEAEDTDGEKSVQKELGGVAAAIDKMGEDFVSVYIADWNGNIFTKAFETKKPVEDAVVYANEILRTSVVYN